jgi:alpha-beta hydrolase superfamily lysophospholipase
MRLALVPATILVAAGLCGCTITVAPRQLLPGTKHGLERWTAAAGPEALDFETIEIAREPGVLLRGWVAPRPDPRAVLLYFYGNQETAWRSRERIHWFREALGVDVTCVDYRGYGFSDGEPAFETLRQDASAMLEHARRRASRRGLPLLVYGRSIGSAVALAALERSAAGRAVSAVVLEAPFTDADEAVAGLTGVLWAPLRWLVRLRAPSSLRAFEPQPIEAIRTIDARLLVLHGDADRVIAPELGRRVFEAAAAESKRFVSIAGAGHNDLDITTGEPAIALAELVERIARDAGR